MKRTGQHLGLILLLCLMIGCAAKARSQGAVIYKDSGLVKPGSCNLKFLLNGQGTFSEYLLHEKAQNPDLQDFDVPGLMKLCRNAYGQLYLPVQPGVPLCNLETNFKHCKGIELQADVEIYKDGTIVLRRWIFYHIRLRLDGDQPNFFRTAKAQRDRGDFALPRHYYVGALVDSIQKSLPILREIATDYRKYIKDDNQEIEIELTLEESREKVEAKKTDENIQNSAELSGKVILSALPSLSFFTGLTVSTLTSGGRTFWEVLKEEKNFDLYKRTLELHQVEFSYTESFIRNFSSIFRNLISPTSDILIQQIMIRLRPKDPQTPLSVFFLRPFPFQRHV